MYSWSKEAVSNRKDLTTGPASAMPAHGQANLPDHPRTSPDPPKPRNRSNGPTLAPSVLRPKVLARNRLASWTPSFSLTHSSPTSAILPANDIHTKFDVMLSALGTGAKENYGAGLIRFTEYCDSRRIPEPSRMPASDELLAAFLASWSGRCSDQTMKNWMSGLQFWHTINNAPWLAGAQSELVRKGASKHVPPSLRPPVARSVLRSPIPILSSS